MPAQLAFDLPISVNKMYHRTRLGVTLTEEAQTWKRYAQLIARNQWEGEPLEGDLVVIYSFFGMTRMDWDNGCKIIGDSMEGIVYINDKQIVEAHIYVYRKDKDRRVEVEVRKKAN